MAGAEQTTYPRMTTIVCLTDLIFALDMPSNEWALGLKDKKDYLLRQGQLQIWTEHSTLIFENLKPVEKSKKHFSIN